MNPSLARLPFATGGLLGAAALALCIGSAGAASAATRPAGPAMAGPVHTMHAGSIHSDACGAPKTYSINQAGGSLKLPSCGGTTGKVTYPSNNAPANTITLTSYTSNPAPSQCGSTTGETALAYVTVSSTGSGAIQYGTTNKKSMLKNAAFPPSATFTLIAYAFGNPQFSVPLGHPNAKHQLKFPSPLNGMTIPLGLPLCFELDTP
jgi:hypothetical protein